MDVKPANGAQQRVGGDHPVTLSQNEPGPGCGQILLRVEDVDRRTLSACRLTPDSLQRDISGGNISPVPQTKQPRQIKHARHPRDDGDHV